MGLIAWNPWRNTTIQNCLGGRSGGKKRDEIIKGSPRCKRCERSGGRLAVHHVYYDYGRLPWDYPDDAYQVVCSGLCHRKADEDREERELSAKNSGRDWQSEEGEKHLRPNKRKSGEVAQYEAEFRTWLMQKGILHEQWDWDLYPMWFLWNQLSKEFFAERHDDDRQGYLPL